MADKKISQLTNATTPLVGTELVPIVQDGTTVKATVTELMAGGSPVTSVNGQTGAVDLGYGDLTGAIPTWAVANGGTGSTTASDARTALSAAVSGANTDITSVALTTGSVSTTPSANTDLANKGYVDGVAQGLDIKGSVVVATTTNITLSGTAQAIDNYTPGAGERVLVKNQTAAQDNGIYVVAAGAWARSTDMDAWTDIPGAFTFIERGTTQADTGWVCTANAGGTLGTTAITWTQFSGAGTYSAGTGLSLTGTTFAIDNTVATLSGSQTLSNKTLSAPVLGTPTSGNFSTGTFTWPTFNQNTTGSSASVSGATQNSITSAVNLTTVGALNSGSITSGFGSIDVGPDPISGGVLTGSSDASIHGLTVGRGAGSVATNTVLGANAGAGITTGANNTFIGYHSAETGSITGSGNVGVGDNTFTSASFTGGLNTGVGSNALSEVTTGQYNTSVGAYASTSLTSGNFNTAIGFDAGYSNVSSHSNTYVGYSAGYYATGTNNNAVGKFALTGANGLSIGSSNSAFGNSALASFTSASANTAIGNDSLTNATSAQANTALGANTLYNNKTSNYSTAIGTSALFNNNALVTAGFFVVGTSYIITTVGTTNFTAIGAASNTVGVVFTATGAGTGSGTATANGGASNTAVGYYAGYENTTGTLNNFLGTNAGRYVTTGSKNTVLGAYDGNSGGLDIRTSSNYIVLSDGDGNPRGYWNTASLNWMLDGLTVGRGAGAVSTNTAVGASALVANTSGVQNNAFGNLALTSATSNGYNDAFGYTALQYNTGAGNAAFGNSAMRGVNGSSTGGSNAAFGASALIGLTTGANNVAVGNSALQANTSASNNTAVGYQAGYSNTTGDTLTAVGYRALYANTTGYASSAFGQQALQANTTGLYNNAFGYLALQANTTGGYNTAFGGGALNSNTTASNNTAVGYQAGYSGATSSFNTYIGRLAGYNANMSGNGINTFIGNAAGYQITSGTKNTIIGSFEGYGFGLDIRTANNYIVLSDGDGNPRQVIDGSGNVGIGTVSPGAKLDVSGTGNFQGLQTSGSPSLSFGASKWMTQQETGTARTYYCGPDASTYQSWEIYRATSTGSPLIAMTLDASGRRMLGTTSPYGIDTVSKTSDNGVAVATNITDFGGAISVIHNQDEVGTGNKTGLFFAHAGSPGLLSGIASTKLSGSWQTTLDFYVNNLTGGNVGTIQLAARIDSSGNLLVGTTSNPLGTRIFGDGGASTNAVGAYSQGSAGNVAFYGRVDSTNNYLALWSYSGSAVGSITTNGAITSYNTTSDYRLKNNQQPLTGSGAFIDALKPKTWTWKADGSTGVGFIAHEFAEVSPSSVSGEKDATEIQSYEVSPAVPAVLDADGVEVTPAVAAVMGEREVPKYQGMQASSSEVIANLVAEIQDLRKRLAAAGI